MRFLATAVAVVIVFLSVSAQMRSQDGSSMTGVVIDPNGSVILGNRNQAIQSGY